MTKHLTPEEQQVIDDEAEAERVYQAELAAANKKLIAARGTKSAEPEQQAAPLDETALAARLAEQGITIVRSSQASDGVHLYLLDHGRDRWHPIPAGSTTDQAFSLITGIAATKATTDEPELDLEPEHKHRRKAGNGPYAPEPAPSIE